MTGPRTGLERMTVVLLVLIVMVEFCLILSAFQ